MSWMDHQIIYQIYPKSFADSNNDGIGDVQGIISKIPYLTELGVTTLWLNPIFVSPQVDNGYDVSNYYAIDARFGSLEDVKKLIQVAHENQLKVIFDFVLNHTSDEHPWFKEAVKNPDGLYRDYYLWSDPSKNGVPNNWRSFFGGSVWEKDPGETNQYYFHLFDKHMPDLNWQNPEVRYSMFEIAKYWVDLGIDGLRLDAFIHIGKADFEMNYPSTDYSKPVVAEAFIAHQKMVQVYLKEFVQRVKAVNPEVFIVGEAASATPTLMVDYTRPENHECDSVITFRSIVEDTSGEISGLPTAYQPHKLSILGMKQSMAEIQAQLDGVSLPVLYWSNHDMSRVATRFGDSHYFNNSLKTLSTMMYLQKGIPIIYYGEELGQTNVKLDSLSEFEDPTVKEFSEKAKQLGFSHTKTMEMLNSTHKMAARGVMHWESGKNYGFSDHCAWKSGKSNAVSYQDEKDNPSSIFQHYRKLIALKKEQLFTLGKEIILNSDDFVYAYKRKYKNQIGLVVNNLSGEKQIFNFSTDNFEIVLGVGDFSISRKEITLEPWASVVLKKERLNDGD